MTVTLSERDFLDQVEPLRREILAHCYRMVGSVHDAEDLVQETYLRAWRSFHGFEERSSLRTWMYRIATNVCLTSLDGRGRRPLPTGLGAPAADPSAPLRPRPEVTWLEPLPSSVLWSDEPADPASVALSRDSVRLAFVAALQHLNPQQRAVLLMRDVLCWHAAEVAEALGLSVASVNSTLQRARSRLSRLESADSPAVPDGDPRLDEMLERYVRAFEEYDVDGIVAMLTADAVWDMPPFEEWYAGAEAIGRLISVKCPASGPGDMRLVRVSANGSPAFGLYMRGDDGVHRAFQLQHVTVTADGVSAVTAWFDTGLFGAFGLPELLPD